MFENQKGPMEYGSANRQLIPLPAHAHEANNVLVVSQWAVSQHAKLAQEILQTRHASVRQPLRAKCLAVAKRLEDYVVGSAQV